MIHLLLSRSITWPLNLLVPQSVNQRRTLLTEDENHELDKSPPLISNKDLARDVPQSSNMDQNQSIANPEILPSPGVLSTLGKHYLTRRDLENLIQARFNQETPRDRIERFLWRDELGKYPTYAQLKDWQCTAVSMGVACIFGQNRKEEMKPVYVRQTTMLKFQDRLTAERTFRQFNIVMFMKEAYRVGILVFIITETIITSQFAIQAYRNKSTIYDCIPGGALVGFMLKMFHSPLGAVVATIQGSFLGFIYGFVHNIGSRLTDRTYEHLHYEQVMQWILYRENAELWSVNLDELPPSYVPPEPNRQWGLGWFKP